MIPFVFIVVTPHSYLIPAASANNRASRFCHGLPPPAAFGKSPLTPATARTRTAPARPLILRLPQPQPRRKAGFPSRILTSPPVTTASRVTIRHDPAPNASGAISGRPAPHSSGAT